MDILANAIHFIFLNMKFCFPAISVFFYNAWVFFLSLPSPAEAQNREEIAPRRVHRSVQIPVMSGNCEPAAGDLSNYRCFSVITNICPDTGVVR
jgi:hypothetical protein